MENPQRGADRNFDVCKFSMKLTVIICPHCKEVTVVRRYPAEPTLWEVKRVLEEYESYPDGNCETDTLSVESVHNLCRKSFKDSHPEDFEIVIELDGNGNIVKFDSYGGYWDSIEKKELEKMLIEGGLL